MQRRLGLLFILFAPLAFASGERGWQFAKTYDGITLHTRPHSDGLVEIRAQMFISTSYSAFLLLLEDSEHVPKWIDNVSHSRVLKQISANENIVYTQFAAPWPAADRDMVTYSQYQVNEQAFKLVIRDAPATFPKQEGYLRITGVSAEWVLEKLDNGTTHIEYTAFANPQGQLPDWLVNKLATDSALATFQGLRREVQQYQGKQHPNIEE